MPENKFFDPVREAAKSCGNCEEVAAEMKRPENRLNSKARYAFAFMLCVECATTLAARSFAAGLEAAASSKTISGALSLSLSRRAAKIRRLADA